MTEIEQPVVEIEAAGHHYTLLGTAHVSRTSADTVRRMLGESKYDAVAVELCPSRYQAITDPDSVARMDLFRVIREGKVPMVTASLALGAFQTRIAEQLGVEPGGEMKAAVEVARAAHQEVVLVDREIGTTLRRVYAAVPWWKRFYLISGLFAGVLSREEVSEEEIERLKHGDVLESTFAEFADTQTELYQPLIDERDRYMAARLRSEFDHREDANSVLVVVGAGHLKGLARYLAEGFDDPAATITTLETLPPRKRWLRYAPWLIVALVLGGFGLGFSRSAELGMQLLVDWVVINGVLCALGAAIAGGHPLTVVTAFVAAPLTSLNPTIGAGVVTAGAEAALRKPTVGDFSTLRSDTTQWRGWRSNRVARTLLIFVASTVGSAIGTWVAGFRIIDRLAG